MKQVTIKRLNNNLKKMSSLTKQEINSKLEAAMQKVEQLRERKKQIEAKERSFESKKKRSEDTRRKILVGAFVLAKIERGEGDALRLFELMKSALTRDVDRALFQADPITRFGSPELAHGENGTREALDRM